MKRQRRLDSASSGTSSYSVSSTTTSTISISAAGNMSPPSASSAGTAGTVRSVHRVHSVRSANLPTALRSHRPLPRRAVTISTTDGSDGPRSSLSLRETRAASVPAAQLPPCEAHPAKNALSESADERVDSADAKVTASMPARARHRSNGRVLTAGRRRPNLTLVEPVALLRDDQAMAIHVLLRSTESPTSTVRSAESRSCHLEPSQKSGMLYPLLLCCKVDWLSNRLWVLAV